MAEIIPLGQRLRERREQLGISQAQAARELDVARTAYRLWELEAARPSSDRWRTISSWLGMSVAALLLAEELTEIGDVEDLHEITRRLREGGTDWNAAMLEPRDHFAHQRTAISDETRRGTITRVESDRLSEMLDRIEGQADPTPTSGWQPAEFRKDLVSGPDAFGEARAALAVTASGIPTEAMERADRLIVALLEDVGGPLPGGSGWIVELHIEVGRRTLRVEASDRPPTGGSDDTSDGWRLIVDEASRWGATGRTGARVRWFEVDLPEPGRQETAIGAVS